MRLFKNKQTIILLFILVYFQVLGGNATQLPTSKEKSLRALYSTGKIKLEQVLKITLDTYPQNVMAKHLSDLIQYKDRLFICDIGTNDVKILDLNGKFIKTFGRNGSGPGDTHSPSKICLSMNRLVIYEIGNRRFSYFDLNGKFIKTENPKIKGMIRSIDSLNDGRIIVHSNRSIGNEEKKEVHEVSELQLFTSEMKYLKTIYSQEEHNYKYMMYEGDARRLIKPFNPTLLWKKLPGNKIVVGFPEKYEFKIIDVDTGVSKTIHRIFKREKITATDKTEYLNDREKTFRYLPDAASSNKFFRNNCEFPEYRPLYSNIISDSEGNILILFFEKGQKGNITSDPIHFFDAFDSEGNFIGHVQVMNKKGFKPYHAVDPAAFWCYDIDDDEEPYWIKYKMSAYEKK